MNTTQISSHERRALGWYAIHWSQTMDWFKTLRKRRPVQVESLPVTADTNQATKEKEKPSPQTEAKKLKEAVKDAHRILAHAESVFPFKVFPESITVDRQKLTIIYKKFFNSKQTVGVPLENVKNIQADLSPFFGSLTITSDLFINNTQTVSYLTRKDARDIQQLVQGIIAANSEGIDLSKVETKQLKDMLCRLGAGPATG